MNKKTAFSRTGLLSILVLASFSLGACSTMKDLSGVNKKTPDEFRVLSKPPLVMPPDYNLRPPRAGMPKPQQLAPSAQAINALFPGRATLPPSASAGEAAMIEAVGLGTVSANIRSVADGNDTIVVEKGTLLRDVLTSGEVVDAPDGSHITRTTGTVSDEAGS